MQVMGSNTISSNKSYFKIVNIAFRFFNNIYNNYIDNEIYFNDLVNINNIKNIIL